MVNVLLLVRLTWQLCGKKCVNRNIHIILCDLDQGGRIKTLGYN